MHAGHQVPQKSSPTEVLVRCGWRRLATAVQRREGGSGERVSVGCWNLLKFNIHVPDVAVNSAVQLFDNNKQTNTPHSIHPLSLPLLLPLPLHSSRPPLTDSPSPSDFVHQYLRLPSPLDSSHRSLCFGRFLVDLVSTCVGLGV
jgi:hypothetical protein